MKSILLHFVAKFIKHVRRVKEKFALAIANFSFAVMGYSFYCENNSENPLCHSHCIEKLLHRISANPKNAFFVCVHAYKLIRYFTHSYAKNGGDLRPVIE